MSPNFIYSDYLAIRLSEIVLFMVHLCDVSLPHLSLHTRLVYQISSMIKCSDFSYLPSLSGTFLGLFLWYQSRFKVPRSWKCQFWCLFWNAHVVYKVARSFRVYFLTDSLSWHTYWPYIHWLKYLFISELYLRLLHIPQGSVLSGASYRY